MVKTNGVETLNQSVYYEFNKQQQQKKTYTRFIRHIQN